MHPRHPMGKEAALRSFLPSKQTPDAGKHSKKRTEKEDHKLLKASNDAVSGTDTCGKTGEKWKRTQCLPTRAQTHRCSPAWGAAALGDCAAGPVTASLAGAGCPHMPAHWHARGPTRPKKSPRQPPLSWVPVAHTLRTFNGPQAQSHTSTHSERNMQSPLRCGVA